MNDKNNITLPREVRFVPCKPASFGAVDAFIWPHIAAKLVREQHAEIERLTATVKARDDEILTHSEAVYEATRLLSEEREKNKRLREAIEAYIRAKDSDGGGKGGFFPKPPTVAHQRRVHLAWQELNAALRKEDV